MSARIAAILVALLVVLGGGALLYQRQSGQQKPEASGTLGQPLLKGLKAADVAAISIREPNATLTLERRSDRWTLAERAGFPAELDRVRDFVLKAIELKIGQSEPAGAADRKRLNLDESGTHVEFKSADGKVLAQLVAGRKYFKREPENPDRAPGDGRFVAIPGNDANVFVVSDPLAQASAKSADWIAKKGLEAEKVKTLEVKYPSGEAWRIERERDDAGWKLAGARPGERIEVTKANAASYSLATLDLADVAPREVKPEATGLDKPVLVTATTLDGLSYGLRIGRLEGENYYVSLASGGSLARAPEKKEDREKMDARLAREKLLSEHVLLVPKSRLEDLLKKRAELLEKKEEKK
jgi:hypothetical protein